MWGCGAYRRERGDGETKVFVNTVTKEETRVDPRIATELEVAGRIHKMEKALIAFGPDSLAFLDE